MSAEEKTINNPQVLNEEEEEEEEEEYVVEEVVKHKITKKNKVEFYLKWKGFEPEDNTWEPAENLNCPELINAYLVTIPDKDRRKVQAIIGSGQDDEEIKVASTEQAAPTIEPTQTAVNGNAPPPSEEKKKTQKRKTTEENPPKKKKKSDKRTTGFDKGLEAEEILGATESNGEVHFLIKWKGVNDAELVPSKIANVKIPQMVISFYEARLTWSTVSGKSADETEDQSIDNRKDIENEPPKNDQIAAQ